jgi:signal transduction histidine kinase
MVEPNRPSAIFPSSLSLSTGPEATFALLQHFQKELLQTQMQLIHAERLESAGRLAPGIAHEVKNPLAVLLMGVEFLDKALVDADPSTRQVLRTMRDAVGRADRIVRGLMKFSAPTDLQRSPHDLNAVVEESLRLVKHELLASHVVTVLELDSAIPPIHIDGPKIEQVLVNVLTNAAHAMSAGGTLTVRSYLASPEVSGEQLDRDLVVIEIDDTGPGIPSAAMEHIFDPFFTTKPASKGNGLGLSVARQIMNLHQGSIELHNRSDRSGVRARITFGGECNESRPCLVGAGDQEN